MASSPCLASLVLLLCLCLLSPPLPLNPASASRDTPLSETADSDAGTRRDRKDAGVAYRDPDRYGEPLQYEEEEEGGGRREREAHDERRPRKQEKEGEDEAEGELPERRERSAEDERPEERYDEREKRREGGAERRADEGEGEEDHRRRHKRVDDDDGDEHRRGRKRHGERRKERGDERKEEDRPERFVIEKFMKAIRTEAGQMYVLPRDASNELSRKRIGLGFLTLEPRALLLPQYSDASCLSIVHKGSGRLSWTDGGDLQEIDLEEGDVFKIESGTVFHLFNKDEGQRLHIFSVHDIPSSRITKKPSHSFFVAGGLNPETVLSGFPEDVLATVFNVSADEVHDTLSSQTKGPIIYFVGNESMSREWSDTALTFPNLLRNLYAESEEPEEEFFSVCRMKKFVSRYLSIAGVSSKNSQKPYNIWKKNPDFSNDYGSASKADEKDLEMLKDLNKGVFAVKLKAGAVMAPHWNPRAMEISLVTKGEGEVQIVYPNGTSAATERVQEGTVFYVPQNFPMCQIASRSGPLEFIGFSTSSKPNNPQFLAGLNSVLKQLKPEVLASSFNIPSEHIKSFIERQTEAVILPGQAVEPESEIEPEAF